MTIIGRFHCMKLAVSQQLINTAHRMCSAGPPDRPPKPKGTEQLQALQQRYNHSSTHLHAMSYGVSRPKMLKSRSQVRRWVSLSYWVEGFCDVCVHACLCTWYTTAWLVPFPLFTLPPSLSSPSLLPPSSLPPGWQPWFRWQCDGIKCQLCPAPKSTSIWRN